LEDDTRELQDKLRPLLPEGKRDRLLILTREDFFRAKIPMSIEEPKFREFVVQPVREENPDLVIFDNLAHLIGADYNDSCKIHSVAQFAWQISQGANAAVIFAAHPRKRGKNDAWKSSLRSDSEGFFEEVMGSSHFINSTGSLWGIERDRDSGYSYFLGGSQRLTGEEGIAALSLNDTGWFEVVPGLPENLTLALNTEKRRDAWKLIPPTFTYLEAERTVKNVMAAGTFGYWWKELTRLKLILPRADRWQKADSAGAGANPSR
jgi:hypothetical protein